MIYFICCLQLCAWFQHTGESQEVQCTVRVTFIFLTDPRFSDTIPDIVPPQDGPFPDYSLGESEEHAFGGYSSRLHFLGSDMDQRPFHDGPTGGSFGPTGGGEDFGRSSLLENNSSSMYPDYQRHPLSHPMDNTLDRADPCERGSDSSSLPNTLLQYLVIPLSLHRILSNQRNILDPYISS